MRATPVILDCDTGTDDAVAILLAALHPELDLLGVTTVWGNHEVADSTDNTLRVLDLIGRGAASGARAVAVHPGRNAPVRPRITELPSGRDDLPATLALPPATSVAGGDAVEWIVETLRATTTPVALVPTGPLTNIAAAVAADPRITERVGRLVILGGAHREAGVTPYAERNVWCDPEAAHDVLAAGFRDMLMVTMDATFSATVGAADAGRLRDTGTVAATTAADMIEQRLAWTEQHEEVSRVGGAPLHDPLAVAALVDPGLLTVLRLRRGRARRRGEVRRHPVPGGVPRSCGCGGRGRPCRQAALRRSAVQGARVGEMTRRGRRAGRRGCRWGCNTSFARLAGRCQT